jgi:FkbM family methyltransferase
MASRNCVRGLAPLRQSPPAYPEEAEFGMINLARNPIAPVLGQHVPLRGPARLLFRSYARCGIAADAGRQVTTRVGDMFAADLASFLEWQLWAFGGYEEYLAELFGHLVEPGHRCIDVGANVGVHTVRLAKLVGQGGEVIAIEPDARLARRAEHNVRLNGLDNVRIVRAAASDRAGGQVQLYRAAVTDSNRARASLLPHQYLTGEAEQVPAVTVDECCDGPVSLIKIDVEGYEAAVVTGAAATIAAYAPSIIFEYAPELLADSADCPFAALQERGYEMYAIHQRRHRVTGRSSLALEPARALPAITSANILAVSPSRAGRVASLVAPFAAQTR